MKGLDSVLFQKISHATAGTHTKVVLVGVYVLEMRIFRPKKYPAEKNQSKKYGATKRGNPEQTTMGDDK